MTRIETYKSNDKNEKRESEKQFSKDGIKYKFLDETYEIVNQEDNFDNEIKTLTINKEIRSKTYSPKKIIKKNGITYKLKNVENSVRTVKKKNGRKVTGYLSFDSKMQKKEHGKGKGCKLAKQLDRLYIYIVRQGLL